MRSVNDFLREADMRGLISIIKAFFVTAIAIGCVIFAYVLSISPVFPKGVRYEFYSGTSSDEIVLSRSPFEKLFLSGVKGESVRYRGDRAQEILSGFGAEILFVEKAAGITNYYCYSPALKNSVSLGGEVVNLHIACNGEETAAGTPLIFGGF